MSARRFPWQRLRSDDASRAASHHGWRRHRAAIAPVAAAQTRSDGADHRRLRQPADPCIAPRGDRLAFTVWHRACNRAPASVFLVPLAGRAARAVTKTRTRDATDVAWAPGGRRLVFSTDAAGIQLANLFVTGADGRNKRRVTRSRSGYDGAPTWSPDGSTIAFESRLGEPDGSAGTTLWTIPAPPAPG